MTAMYRCAPIKVIGTPGNEKHSSRGMNSSEMFRRFVHFFVLLTFDAFQGESKDVFVGSSDGNQIPSTSEKDYEEPKDVLNFQTSASHMVLSFQLSVLFSFKFMLKTRQSSSLILYSGNVHRGVASSRDFMALEMVEGRLRFSFDLGNGVRIVSANTVRRLNDGAWHLVLMSRSSQDRYNLLVDGEHFLDLLPSNTPNTQLDTGDELFIGGIPGYAFNVLSRDIVSGQGFIGCMASAFLNEHRVNLLENPFNIPSQHRNFVVPGCPQKQGMKGCTDETCNNGGTCQEQLDGHTCNCDATSFTGPTCNVDSVAYHFKGRSLITFKLPETEWLDTRRDEISFGFKTNQTDAILLTMSSATSNDYVEVEIVEGKILVVYNVGSTDHPVGELFTGVDDGQYHVVRFTRDGQNATIQLDGLPVQPKYPTGNHSITFNHLSRVSIGGRSDSDGVIKRQFQGIISGLVVDSFKILDLAAEGDERITFHGDIELHMKPLRSEFPVTTTTLSVTSSLCDSDYEGCLWRKTTNPQHITTADVDEFKFETRGRIDEDTTSSGAVPCSNLNHDDDDDDDDDDCRRPMIELDPTTATEPRTSTENTASRKQANPLQSSISVERNASLVMNIALISGIGAGVLVLLSILVYAVCRYRTKEVEIRKQHVAENRARNSYSTDFEFPPSGGGGIRRSTRSSKDDSLPSNDNLLSKHRDPCFPENWQNRKGKKRGVKEWYV